MIFGKPIRNWRELQSLVALLLNQCGIKAEVEKSVDTVRSNYKADVYAEEVIFGRTTTIICECKFWKSRIPQKEVNNLRIVLGDTGKNKGYFITSSDYQRGAHNTVEFTNIALMTWDQFQKEFFENWYCNYFHRNLSQCLHLGAGVEYHWVDWYDELINSDRLQYQKLKGQLQFYDQIVDHFPWPGRMMLKSDFDLSQPLLPLSKMLSKDLLEEFSFSGFSLPDSLLSEAHFNDFLVLFEKTVKPVINDFLELNAKYKVE